MVCAAAYVKSSETTLSGACAVECATGHAMERVTGCVAGPAVNVVALQALIPIRHHRERTV